MSTLFIFDELEVHLYIKSVYRPWYKNPIEHEFCQIQNNQPWKENVHTNNLNRNNSVYLIHLFRIFDKKNIITVTFVCVWEFWSPSVVGRHRCIHMDIKYNQPHSNIPDIHLINCEILWRKIDGIQLLNENRIILDDCKCFFSDLGTRGNIVHCIR